MDISNVINEGTVSKNISRIIKAADIALTDAADQPSGMFGQKAVIKIGDSITIDSDTIDVEFTVPFDCDCEPNEAEIVVYNLSKNTLANIKYDSKISIEAGYGDDTGIIFTGYISEFSTERDESEQKITIYALDDQSLTDREIQEKSYAENVQSSYILKDILNSTGLPFAVFNPADDYVNKDAVKVDGMIIDAVKKYAEDCGSAAYVQKGKIYVLDIRTASEDINFTICADTGMIGSPEGFTEQREIRDGESDATEIETITGYNIDMLLQHRIQCGVKVKVESSDVSGVFSVRSGEHSYNGTEMVTSLEIIA